MEKPIPLGRISKTFGLVGGVFCKLFNNNSNTLRPGITVYLAKNTDNRHCEKLATKQSKNSEKTADDGTAQQFVELKVRKVLAGGRLFFEGIDRIEEAQDIVGLEIFVDRRDFLELENPDEHYQDDLIGLSCFDIANNFLGELIGFSHNKAQVLANIKKSDGHVFSVPWVSSMVKEVILGSHPQKIILDLPEGLMDL